MSQKTKQEKIVRFPTAFISLFHPSRYKVYYGGRGGAKSWCVARALIVIGMQRPVRILCAREFQSSITDSVHKLLGEQIDDMGFSGCYAIQRTRIVGMNGTEFIFKGLRNNVQEIKSTEGVDYCWVEEAQSVSEESWAVLIPTIRQPNSEIWLTFNPRDMEDATYRRFVVNPPPNTILQKVSWRDNDWFPDVLRQEMEYLRRIDYDAYLHVWEGEPRTISDAVVFKGKFFVENFDTPEDAIFYHGADWGFSQDPTTLIRMFVKENTLYIDREAYAIGCDIDKTPALFDTVENSRKWKIYADGARPETISYMKRSGFKIESADKWSGSVEDGVAFMRSFERIVIHERCKHTAEEFRLYKYKVDPTTNEIYPKIVDKYNHCIDAIRYALSPLIQMKRKMARPVSRPAGL